MLINTKKCIGCYACRTACQRQNGLDPTDSFIRFEEREVGEYPSVSVEHVPLQCMHCEDAPCCSVCPTGAAHIGPDGIVEVDQGRCIGCVTACPTGARIFGDLDDPDCELVKEIAATHAAPIAGDLTKSKVYYVR